MKCAVQWALKSVVFNHSFTQLLESGYDTSWHFHFSTAPAKFLLSNEWQTPFCINDQDLAWSQSDMPQKICKLSERECIVNIIHLLVSVIFGLHLHWHAISGESQLGVINASLRSRRQPRKSLTAVSSLAAPGEMWFPTSMYSAKWHSDMQAADGRVGRG